MYESRRIWSFVLPLNVIRFAFPNPVVFLVFFYLFLIRKRFYFLCHAVFHLCLNHPLLMGLKFHIAIRIVISVGPLTVLSQVFEVNSTYFHALTVRLEVFQVTLIESIVSPNPSAKPSGLAFYEVALKYVAPRHACVQESS